MFLDKDGTLVENIPYNFDPSQIRLTKGAGEGLRLLSAFGFEIVTVTNQPGIALGYGTDLELKAVRCRIEELLLAEGVYLSGFYYCPHLAAAGCQCRKPNPGLIERIAVERCVSLSQSWAIGDILDDVEAGKRAGCRCVLLDNGNETEWVRNQWREPDFVARDLLAAARRIADGEGIRAG